jgi:diketogulonate reductase-like aldo/keto reductase
VPLKATLEAFAVLIAAGKIRHWGVSNFDVDDMDDLWDTPGGRTVSTNQILYNLTRRGIEYRLMPWCRRHRIPLMAYAPVEQGRLLGHPALRRVAERHRATPAQVALAWVLRQDGVIAIPKAGTVDHVHENRRALDLELTQEDLAALDRAFPPPTRALPLEVL